MAHATLLFKNQYTDEEEQAPVGYSWLFLLFGFFVPSVKEDWKSVFLIGLIYVSAIFVTQMEFFTILLPVIEYLIGVSFVESLPILMPFYINVLMGFFYNRIYIQHLLSKGYSVSSVTDGDIDIKTLEKKLRLQLPAYKTLAPKPPTPEIKSSASSIEELEKLAELKDKGIITPEEFDQKKKQLLESI